VTSAINKNSPAVVSTKVLGYALAIVAAHYNCAMPDGISSSASSNSGNIEDIVRLIAPSDRVGFNEMLAHALRGRELLSDDELRRVAVNTWHAFCKHGWPRT